jgi:hypothetical protein
MESLIDYPPRTAGPLIQNRIPHRLLLPCSQDLRNLVSKVGAKDDQESDGNVFRQSDGDFLLRVSGVHGEIDRRSHRSVVFCLSLGEFPVNVDALAVALA